MLDKNNCKYLGEVKGLEIYDIIKTRVGISTRPVNNEQWYEIFYQVLRPTKDYKNIESIGEGVVIVTEGENLLEKILSNISEKKGKVAA